MRIIRGQTMMIGSQRHLRAVAKMLAKSLLKLSYADFVAADVLADQAGFDTWEEITKLAEDGAA